MPLHLPRSPRPIARRAALPWLAAAAWLAAAPPAAGQQRPPEEREPFELWSLVSQPRLQNRDEMLREIAARYPPTQREAGVVGDVMVGFRILPDGSVDSASVSVEYATDAAFVEPAAAVARRLRFDPRRALGRPSVAMHLFPVHFDARTPAARPAPPSDTGAWELWSVDELPGLRPGPDLRFLMNRRYPPAQLDSGVPGDVLLRFRVMGDGTVDAASLSVLQASNAAFVEPASAIARELRFTPAKVRSRPVAAWFILPLHFRAPPRSEGRSDEGTYELSPVEEQPRLLNGREIAAQLRAQYPPALRDSLINGTVEMRFRIMEDGTVDPATISVERATHAAFGEAARGIVGGMRFAPAKAGGRPVKVWITVPITFEREGAPPARSDSTRAGASTPPAGARP